MKRRLQELLIAEYDGRALRLICEVRIQPLRRVSRLLVFRLCGHEAEILIMKIVETILVQGVWELAQVLSEKAARLCGIVNVEAVIIPIKQGAAGLLKMFEQHFLHFVERIKAYKNVQVGIGAGQILSGAQPLRNFAKNSAFVGLPILF